MLCFLKITRQATVLHFYVLFECRKPVICKYFLSIAVQENNIHKIVKMLGQNTWACENVSQA